MKKIFWFRSITRFLPIAALLLMTESLWSESGAPDFKLSLGDPQGAAISPAFAGLSYESALLLPNDGHYYFDASNLALIHTFQTLGIKSLRVGANAVDDPRVPIPSEKDIDALFTFAKAANVKVIYSFRLKNGDPTETARLACYINSHYPDTLDSFSIGNEPECYFPNYDDYFKVWKPHYDAIVKALPSAKIDGPSSNKSEFTLKMARDLFADGHLSMVSQHTYFLGSGRKAEADPAATRARFLSNSNEASYQTAYSKAAAILATKGVPYRIDELNNCYNGGAAGASNTYASSLWLLDCMLWWADHHILGMNFHTGELVGRDGKFAPPNYALFLRSKDSLGFDVHPAGYAMAAFCQAAQGRPLPVQLTPVPTIPITAYAFKADNGSLLITVINKTYGDKAQSPIVAISLPSPNPAGKWQQMLLEQKNQDVAAETGVTLGGSEIDLSGAWSGNWKDVPTSNSLQIHLNQASAVILRFVPN